MYKFQSSTNDIGREPLTEVVIVAKADILNIYYCKGGIMYNLLVPSNS